MSATDPAFVKPAAMAVLTCRFTPARIDGVATRIRVSQPLTYMIR